MIESLFSCCLRIKICFILRTGDFPARKDLKNVSYLVYPGTEVSSREHVYVCLFLKGFPEEKTYCMDLRTQPGRTFSSLN